MEFVKPMVFHVAQTRIIESGMVDYFEALGIPDWVTDAPSDAERLVAEEEIRLVFGRVAEEQRRCYPNLYQDMKSEMVDGLLKYTFGERCDLWVLK